MKNPKLGTKVVHSRSKTAWNVIGLTLGKKHKVAIVPYISGLEIMKVEALEHAEFISYCFNNSETICKFLNQD